jgi:putative transposase
MKQRIVELSQAHPRYGYRRIEALLRREGQRVNAKRVQRIRRQEDLVVRKKQRATRRIGISTGTRQRARAANEVWSWTSFTIRLAREALCVS